MMTIPHRVDAKLRSKSAKSTARLRYIVAQLAATYTARNSVRALAELVGIDHSTISIYIKRGAFSDSATAKIMAALPDLNNISKEHLTNPMSIAHSPG
jgi:IS30 family transposase